jgi:preprotein translocase YajC subunit
MFFLLDDANVAASATQWILPAVLLVLVVGIFVLNYFRSKKTQENMKTMVSSLKVGDHVKTYSGIYGTILEIIETTDGKVAVLETGSEKNRGIFSIDINAIFGIDAKQPVVYDEKGNVLDPNVPVIAPEIEKVEEKKTEEKKAEVKSVELKKTRAKTAKVSKEEKPAVKKAVSTNKPAKKSINKVTKK